jgi:hypothetical protein
MDKEKQADYHCQIINIQIDEEERKAAMREGGSYNRMYKLGHRDARHHAAEIANDADAEIARLNDEIERKDEALNHIIEYWNGASESAVDAIEEAISTAEQALANPEEVEG